MRHFPVWCFLLLAGGFGLAFLYLTPPYQGPDEPNHLYRAYAVSTGAWEPATEGTRRRGGQVPRSLRAMFADFSELRWNGRRQTEPARIDTFATLPLAAARTEFVDYPNTAVYPALVYAPAAVGLWIARALDTSALTTLRLARGAGLLFWLICGAVALSLLPAWRWLLLAVWVLPMATFTHAVVSADTFTDGITVLVVAYLLHLAYGKRGLGGRDLGWLLLLTVLLASAKFVYVPLLLLALLIPEAGFRTRFGRRGAGAIVIGTCLLTVAFWSARSAEIYLPYADYATEYRSGLDLHPGVDMHEQRRLIVRAPIRYFRAVKNSAVQAFEMYSRAYIGNFGWLDTPLPWVAVVLAYAGLLVAAGFDRTPGFAFSTTARLLLLITVVLCYGLVVLSQQLSWEPVGSTTVGTIQGRYLTPFAPLLFLAFTRRGRRPGWLSLFVAGGSALLLGYSLWIAYHRYYLP